jgi:hypothetical protein
MPNAKGDGMSDEPKQPVWLTIVNSLVIVLMIYGGAYLGLACKDLIPQTRFPRTHAILFVVPVGAVGGGIAAVLLTKWLTMIRRSLNSRAKRDKPCFKRIPWNVPQPVFVVTAGTPSF